MKEYAAATQVTYQMWARNGFNRDSPNNLLKANVRQQLFDDVMEGTATKIKDTREGLRSQPTEVSTQEAVAYEGLLKQAVSTLKAKGTKRADVIIAYVAVKAYYAGLGIDITDVFDELGWPPPGEDLSGAQ